jgi:hypothetical protein
MERFLPQRLQMNVRIVMRKVQVGDCVCRSSCPYVLYVLKTATNFTLLLFGVYNNIYYVYIIVTVFSIVAVCVLGELHFDPNQSSIDEQTLHEA